MKTLIYQLSILLLIVFTSCNDDQRGQYSIHGNPPQPITKISEVQSFPGGVTIHYVLPNDRDLLYVVARYTLDTGQEMLVKVSKYESAINVVGYRDEAPRTVELRTVDRSQNESEPINIVVTPKESPIFDVLRSMEAKDDFGGIGIRWKNESANNITVVITTPLTPTSIENDLNNEVYMKEVTNWPSSARDGVLKIRGYDPDPVVFGIQVRDHWGNITHTEKAEYLPIYEEICNKRHFAIWYGDPNIPQRRYNNTYIETMMWDDIVGVNGNFFHTADPTINPAVAPLMIPPMAFTFDLGRVYQLSRFKMWHRATGTWPFTHNNPKRFVLYGSEHAYPKKILDDSTDPADEYNKWKLLGDYDTIKPSGLPINQLSDEDRQVAEVDGIDYDIEFTTIPVRYIRMDVLQTWGNTPAIHIGELTFWGKEIIAEEDDD